MLRNGHDLHQNPKKLFRSLYPPQWLLNFVYAFWILTAFSTPEFTRWIINLTAGKYEGLSEYKDEEDEEDSTVPDLPTESSITGSLAHLQSTNSGCGSAPHDNLSDHAEKWQTDVLRALMGIDRMYASCWICREEEEGRAKTGRWLDGVITPSTLMNAV